MRNIKTIKKGFKKGFTLIELMIVVAILSILTVIAMPVYQSYNGKAQVSEALLLADSKKSQIAEYVAINGSLPPSTYTGITSSAGKYVTVAYGKDSGNNPSITMTFNTSASSELQGKTLYLTPILKDNVINFNCGKGTASTSSIDPDYLPKACQN